MRTFEEFHRKLNRRAHLRGQHYGEGLARAGVHRMKHFLEGYLKSDLPHEWGLCALAVRGEVGTIACHIVQACRDLLPEVDNIWGSGAYIGYSVGRTPERTAVAGLILDYLREVTK